MNIPSQFFADGELIEVTPKTRELIDCWSGLSEEQRDAALFLLKNMNQKKSKKDAGCYVNILCSFCSQSVIILLYFQIILMRISLLAWCPGS